MVDLIMIAVLAAVIGGAIFYMVRAKKNGARCVGCSAAGCCGKQGVSGKGCSCGEINS